MRRLSAVCVLLLAVIAGAGMGLAMAEDPGQQEVGVVHACAADSPENFTAPVTGNETIGWVDGYWYDQPINLTIDDGLNETELDRLSARTAARIEALRCLSFDRVPDVEIVDRETFANETERQFAAVSENDRRFDDAQFGTMLLIGENATEVRQESLSGGVGGYYDYVEERIVVIAEDPDHLVIDEPILAHELGHALQDQHFDLERYNRSTKDLDRGKLGLIEGDVHRIEHTYLEHCDAGTWTEPCVSQLPSTNPSASDPPSWGLWVMQYQPYSDGPAFVEHVYEQSGWEGVNALYDDPPRSAAETIQPDADPSIDPETLTVDHPTNASWELLETNRSVDHNVIGPAGIVGMLIDPVLEVHPRPITGAPISADAFITNDPTDPYEYHQPVVEGWEGDRLYVYDDGSATATVWKTTWNDQYNQSQFRNAYIWLAEHRGGERVPGKPFTWTFDNHSEFDGAVTIYPDEDRLWIISGPTVASLDNVTPHVQPLTTTELASELSLEGIAGDQNETIRLNDDELPGFGPVMAIIAVVMAALAARGRRRRGA